MVQAQGQLGMVFGANPRMVDRLLKFDWKIGSQLGELELKNQDLGLCVNSDWKVEDDEQYLLIQERLGANPKRIECGTKFNFENWKLVGDQGSNGEF